MAILYKILGANLANSLLLLAQTILMATNRAALHKQLGMVSLALAPMLVIVGFFLIPIMRHQTADAILHAPRRAESRSRANRPSDMSTANRTPIRRG